MTEPSASQATCLLCRPPQTIGEGILDHLRLLHPDAMDTPARSPDAPPELPVIHPLDIERGAVCMDCGRTFRPGERYEARLTGMVADSPISETICLDCDG